MSRRVRGSKNRDDLPMRADINVTSLVDVAFTLLLIFIITAPILQGGLDLNLPSAAAEPFTGEDDPFILEMKDDGTYWVGETEFVWADLLTGLVDMYEASQSNFVALRADSLAPSGMIPPVLSLLGENEIEARWVVETRDSGG